MVSILSILGYVVMADYNGEIKKSRVRVAGETIYSELQDLRVRVSSGGYEVSGEYIDDEGDVQTDKVFTCWGVQFSGDSVNRVYAEYDDGCDFGNYVFEKEVDLGDGVGVVSGEGYVFFEPPYADMKVFNVDLDELEELEVVFGDGSYEKSIFINSLTENIELETS